MKKIALFFIFFLSGLSFGASYDPTLKWQTIKTPHFHIHFAEGLEERAELCSKYLEEAHEKLTKKFNWAPWGFTDVLIVDNNDNANASTSTLPYNWMIIRLSAPDADSILAYYDDWLRTVIFHEYTHILHIDRTGGIVKWLRPFIGKMISPNGTVPGWMREGIATYFETKETTAGRGSFSYSEMMLRTSILENKFPKIDEADGLSWKWPSYQTMYIYGVKFLQYLVDTYGEEKLMEFHKNMGSTLLFFDVDHQARKIYSDKPQFISQKRHNRYVRLSKPGINRRVVTFPLLWKEWEDKLRQKYAEEKSALEAEGVTEFEKVASGETKLSSPNVSTDGRYLVYARSRVRAPNEIRLIDLLSGEDKVVIKRHEASSIAFSPDSKKLAYSSLGVWKKYNLFSDIYLYDIENRKITRLTNGARASDPAFSPDGKKIVFVQQEKGDSWLSVYDVESKESSNVPDFQRSNFTRFSQPSWSPDGKFIAVSSHQQGQWDIYLYDAVTGKKVSQLTNDIAIDSHPTWSADGNEIYFSSDRSGINNIYKISTQQLKNSQTQKLTNVLTGAFQPSLSPDGKTLYVQYYNGDGYDIRKTELRSKNYEVGNVKDDGHSRESGNPVSNSVTGIPAFAGMTNLASNTYSPFSKSLFLPRFTVPTVAYQDNAFFFDVFTGSTDPLRRHIWRAGASYRTDIFKHLGYYFNYTYNRFVPIFSLGINEYPVKFGNITFLHADGTTNTVKLYEGRRRLFSGITYPFGLQAFGLAYFWEDRRSLSDTTSSEEAALNLGKFAGFSLTFNHGQMEKYPASISPEKGRRLRTNFTITDHLLNSNERNEQRIFAGDYREYISMPWLNHVLALRVGGGMTWGDRLVQGTFTLGGDLGEGTLSGGGSLFYFPLRGLLVAHFSRTRAMLLSAEYRVPLISPQRGLSTRPYYLKNIHLAPFLDYGDAWVASTNMWGEGKYFFNDFMLGTGLELRGDFVIGHGLPLTGRLGYGIVLLNRDRAEGSTAPLFKNSLKYGVAILQLGTAF